MARVKRWLRGALLVASGGAAGLALAGAAFLALGLATAPGRNLMRRWAVEALERRLDGRVRVGYAGGSLWRAAELRDVSLESAEGRPAISVERIRVRYALADVLRGRYRLSRVELLRPVVILEQDSTGRWNVERIFRTDEAGPPRAGRAPLVELSGVRLVDGTLVVREHGDHGMVERSAHRLTADVRRLRLSHPDSGGILADVAHLAARFVNPGIEVRRLDGKIALDGDSMHFDLRHLELPASTAALSGRVRWGSAGTLVVVNIDSPRLSFADLRELVGSLPSGGGRVSGRFQRLPSGALDVDLERVDIRGDGSAVRGRARVSVAPDRRVAVRGADLTLAPLDPVLLERWLGPAPVKGPLRGVVRGDGPLSDLTLWGDVVWTDAEAEGRPSNAATFSGRLALGGPDGLAFDGIAVERADLDLRTVRRIIPAAALTGRLSAAGRLQGPWRRARFEGVLSHADTGVAPTQSRGTVAWELGDSVRLDAELDFDSLSLDLVRRGFESLPLTGSARGHLALHGYLEGLGVSVDLAGPAAQLRATGTLQVGDSATRVVASGSLAGLDLNAQRQWLPPTDLAARWSVGLLVPRDTGEPATGTVQLSLDRSLVSGVELQRAGAMLQLRRARIELDSVRLEAPGAVATATGSIPRGDSVGGVLRLAVSVDTLAVVEPLVRWLLASRGDSTPVRLDGRLSATARLAGTASRWEADGRFAVTSLAYGELGVEQARLQGTVARSDEEVGLRIELAVDSASWGRLSYAPVGASIEGRLDSVAARVSAGFSPSSGLHAQFELWGDSGARHVQIDSLRFELPSRVLELARPSRLAITDEAVIVDSLEFLPRGIGGRLFANGRLPRAAPGSFTLLAQGVPLTDLAALIGRDTSGVGGRLDVAARIVGAATDPTMEVAVAVADGRFGEYRAPLIQALLRYGDRRLTLKGGLWREDVRVVSLSGSVPVDLSLQPVLRRRLGGPIAFQARSDSVDMAVLGPLTDLATDLAGSLSLEVAVAGSWDDPSLTGFVDVAGGAMTVPALGARYTDIDLRLVLEGDTVRVARGRLRAGGELDVSGGVRLVGGALPRLDLALRARRFAAFDIRDFGGLTASGAVALQGPVLGATLRGRLVVDAGYLKFADLVQKRVVNLDDPEFRAIVDSNLARASGLGPEAHTVFFDSLRIDSLVVAMGEDVWLRSSEANIQLEGQFTVDRWIEERLPRYRLDGTMRASRGSYRLVLGYEPATVTRDFRVTQGTVRFFGTPEFNPDLDVIAEHQVRTVQGRQLTVRARIGGTLLYPRLSLESDERPRLSETEIVEYLVFGQPVSALQETSSSSAISQVSSQLAAGIAGSVGQGLISDLGLPLDYLTLTPGSGPRGLAASRIGAGLQIGRSTFLTVTAGLCEVTTSRLLGGGLEQRLSQRWSVAAAFEPVVQECGTSHQLRGLASKYQLSFDLNWQQGVR